MDESSAVIYYGLVHLELLWHYEEYVKDLEYYYNVSTPECSSVLPPRGSSMPQQRTKSVVANDGQIDRYTYTLKLTHNIYTICSYVVPQNVLILQVVTYVCTVSWNLNTMTSNTTYVLNNLTF